MRKHGPPAARVVFGVWTTTFAVFVNIGALACACGGPLPTYLFAKSIRDSSGSAYQTKTQTRPPYAPSVQRLEAGAGQILVAWQDMSWMGNLPETFNVYVNTRAGAAPEAGMRITGIRESYALLTGLDNDTTYYVSVTAINATGESYPTWEYPVRPWTRRIKAASSSSPASAWMLSILDGFLIDQQGDILRWRGNAWERLDQAPYAGSGMWSAIWASGPDNAFVVGRYGAIARFDGMRWELQPSGTYANLNAIWGRGRNDVWAVGEPHYRPGAAAVHHDGVRWSPRAAPGAEGLAFVGGGPAGDVYAISVGGTVWRYDGAAWHGVSWPPADFLIGLGYQQKYKSLLAVGPDDLWAIADHMVSNFNNRYGSSGHTGINETTLAAIGGSGPSIYVVGSGGKILEGPGWPWFEAPSRTTANLISVQEAAGQVLAVGSDGTVLRRDSEGWVVQTAGAGSGTPPSMGALWPLSGDRLLAFAEGRSGDQAIWLRTVLGRWEEQVSTGVPIDADRDGSFWGNSDVDVIAVVGNRIYRYDGAVWNPEASPDPSATLFDIWGAPDAGVWVAGSGGTILHRGSAGWAVQSAPIADGLRAVWGFGAREVFAVTEWGVTLRYDGTSWYRIPGPIVHRVYYSPGQSNGVTGMWGTSGQDLWISAWDGLHHFDGVAWQWFESPISFVRGVYGTSATDIVASGRDGIAHFDGEVWSIQYAREYARFGAVVAGKQDDFWISESSGPVVIRR